MMIEEESAESIPQEDAQVKEAGEVVVVEHKEGEEKVEQKEEEEKVDQIEGEEKVEQIEGEEKVEQKEEEEKAEQIEEEEKVAEDSVVGKAVDGAVDEQGQEITPESDLSHLNRRIFVVTTASLPWRTGTAVNPLARALYLTRGRPKHYITLVIPWLENQQDQAKLFGEKCTFGTRDEQEKWIRDYCKERVNCEEEAENLKILFYSASYQGFFGSIFATEDICSLIPSDEADVAILEEPEHLNWFRVPPSGEVEGATKDDEATSSAQEKAELGWMAKFKHVVGILHTNYSAYMHQYGIGTSFIAASALGALSSIVVRAYCHRVIRLSATLPHLDESKEVTCNVHGVRSEFLDPPVNQPLTSTEDNDDAERPAAIYFIGKLIWAKGFDKVLEIEEDFREATGDYFPFDVYGGGNDETAIKRAFLGRKGILQTPKENDVKPSGSNVGEDERETDSPTDKTAALVFGGTGSLRGQLEGGDQNIEVVLEEDTLEGFAALRASFGELPQQDDNAGDYSNEKTHPLDILGDLSGKTKDTGRAMTCAVGKLTDKLVSLGFHVAFSKETKIDADSPDGHKKKGKFRFDPPKSRFELRRKAIPARFLGVKDHALIRDIVEHKVFLNMSTTEVLCTTTAEALAMGKIVIIPRHPSNEFFYQFPNCLSYGGSKECVRHIKWALENAPKPLSEKHRFMLSWEGATERLYKAAAITVKEIDERTSSGAQESDVDVAKMHMATVKRGHAIQTLITGKKRSNQS